MKVFKNLRYKLQSLLLKKLFISGVEILRAQDSDVEIEKLQSIKNPKTRLLAAEQLVSKNSKNPKTQPLYHFFRVFMLKCPQKVCRCNFWCFNLYCGSYGRFPKFRRGFNVFF